MPGTVLGSENQWWEDRHNFHTHEAYSLAKKRNIK